MKTTLQDLSNDRNEFLNKDHEVNKRKVQSFSDPRIVGLQCMVDYVLSNKGTIKNHNTIDVTEFFRLSEPFSNGFSTAQETIAPALGNTYSHFLNVLEFHRLLSNYDQVLGNNSLNDYFSNLISVLSKSGSNKSKSLVDKTFMNPEEETIMFRDKKVIVTGSNTGIGRETAIEFARRGAKVVFHYPFVDASRGAMSAVDLIKEYGKKAEVFGADFNDMKEIETFTDDALNYLGGLDILVNNSGISFVKPFDEVNETQFDTLVNVNLKAPFFITQIVLPYLKKSKGSIVNLASTHGVAGKAGNSAYAATKGAIIALTKQLGIELAPDIRVNAIAPGGVAVTSHYELMPNVNFNDAGKNIPSGFLGRPIDTANLACFLASNQSRYITSQTIVIDGGMTSGMYTSNQCKEIMNVPFGKGYIK
jgi:NAD(P)-dependent dehydrogenase (short-subunit alcohol dehydrogenase family)